jgi:hypothetical protein
MMTIVENIQCRSKAGPGVLSRVDLAQKAGNGMIPSRAISCLTVNEISGHTRKYRLLVESYLGQRRTSWT